jgi:membrane protein
MASPPPAAARLLEMAWGAAQWTIPAGLTFLVFLLLYRYVPPAGNRFREVLPGAIIGTLLFEAAKHGFAFYVSYLSRHEVLYGALGSLMLFMLWVYLSAMILLFGAEVAAVPRRRAP